MCINLQTAVLTTHRSSRRCRAAADVRILENGHLAGNPDLGRSSLGYARLGSTSLCFEDDGHSLHRIDLADGPT